MTTYYVGSGGNDSNAGTSWAQRKLTLNGAEDIPVVAGDTVYVGAGTYRETLTVDVSGSSGSPITYIGDYTGANTDGTGGVVRITGSDNDQTATRAYCITATEKNYRTFTGFSFDGVTNYIIALNTSSDHWTIQQCFFDYGLTTAIRFLAAPTNHTITNCLFNNGRYSSVTGVFFLNGSTELNSSGNVISNCIFNACHKGIESQYVGDVIVKNCSFINSHQGIRTSAVNTSNPLTVTNSLFVGSSDYGLSAAVLGQIIENYCNFYGNKVDRGNVSTGAQSLAYIYPTDSRYFFKMLNGGSMLTPFDMASYSELIDVAGTSPTTADMRGTTVQGTQREWGALEYDSTLDIEAGSGSGGSVKILPYSGKVGLA